MFWYFDKEMAKTTEDYYKRGRAKLNQYIGFEQNARLLPFDEKFHAQFVGNFQPEKDGVTFHLKAVYTDSLRKCISNEHAFGKPEIIRICGPVEKLNDTIFAVRFYRIGFDNRKRTGDIWLLSRHSGDNKYKSTVQQVNIRISYSINVGIQQIIDFPEIPDHIDKLGTIKLNAVSTSGLPVYYYTKEGPALIENDRLIFTKIPLRTKFPIKVTVAAWQFGRVVEPKVQRAKPVVRSFYLYKDVKRNK